MRARLWYGVKGVTGNFASTEAVNGLSAVTGRRGTFA